MKITKLPIENVPVSKEEIIIAPLHGSKNMGYAVFAPGARAPAQGLASHAEDEYAYIISGSLKCFSGGEHCEVKAGDATFIPAGEEHYSSNESDEPCTLVYMLAERRLI